MSEKLEFRKVITVGDQEYAFRVQTLRDTVEINRKVAELSKKYMNDEEIGSLNYAMGYLMEIARLSVLEDTPTKTEWEDVPTPIADAVDAELRDWFGSFRESRRKDNKPNSKSKV